MRKIFPVLFVFALFLAFLSIQKAEKPASEVPSLQKSGPMHPGWIEQYREMKGNIPEGVASRILAQQKRLENSSRSSNLLQTAFAGPNNVGGRTRAMAIDMLDNNRILAGGISAGIWESTNRGVNWAPLNDLAPSLSVTYISQDPISKIVWFYCTGEPRGNSADIGGNGVYKSVDGGHTFSQIPGTDITSYNNAWVIKASPLTFGVVYLGTASGLFRSDDGGNNFNQVLSGGACTDVELFADGTVLATLNTAGIFFSPTGLSNSFVEITSGLPITGFQRIELAYCRDFPNVVYAMYEGPGSYNSGLEGFYRSTNGGLAWERRTNPDSLSGFSFNFPWYASLIAVKPDDPDFVLCGSVDMGFTTNGGQSWTESASSHADYHIAVFDQLDPNQVFVGNDGGIWRYTASTIGFLADDLNTGYNTTQYYTGALFPSGNSFLGGLQDNGTYRNLNGNPNFKRVFGGDGSYCQVNQQNPNISFVSYQNGNISRSNNSQDLNPQYNSILQLQDDLGEDPWFINPFEINLANGNQLFLASRERIWRSLNGGNSWEPAMNPIPGASSPSAIAIGPESDPTVFTGGSGTRLYRIENAATAAPGAETNLSGFHPPEISGSFINCLILHPDSAGILYAALSNYSPEARIYRITDAKTSVPVWTAINGDLPSELPVNWIAVHPQKPDSFLVAGTDFGLYTTTNGGQNWVQETDIPNVPVFMLRMRPGDLQLFVFTHGRGVWTAQLPDFQATAVDPGEFANGSLRIFPNPARDVLNLEWEAPTPGSQATFEIMDLSGRRIAGPKAVELKNTIDISALPAGTYVLNLRSREGRISKRFIKSGN
jgi:photosystem II stability/assembly factor-like uncharacterized protein